MIAEQDPRARLFEFLQLPAKVMANDAAYFTNGTYIDNILTEEFFYVFALITTSPYDSA